MNDPEKDIYERVQIGVSPPHQLVKPLPYNMHPTAKNSCNCKIIPKGSVSFKGTVFSTSAKASEVLNNAHFKRVAGSIPGNEFVAHEFKARVFLVTRVLVSFGSESEWLWGRECIVAVFYFFIKENHCSHIKQYITLNINILLRLLLNILHTLLLLN